MPIPGLFGGAMPPGPGGLFSGAARPNTPQTMQEAQPQRKPNLLDRVLGLYGQDPRTHIPDEQRKGALGDALMRAGIQTAMAGGRGHDSLTPAQAMASMLGGMRQQGPIMAQQNRANELRQMIGNGNLDNRQMEALMMEFVADGTPESLASAKLIQDYLTSGNRAKLGEGQFTLGEDQTRFDAYGNPIAYGKSGLNTGTTAFDDLVRNDLGDYVQYQHPVTGQVVHSYRKADANALRDDFEKEIQQHGDIAEKLATIESAATNPSPAGDIAMVFSFMKIMDPTSVVRESEYATAANAAGVPDRLRVLYNKLLRGEQLAPAQRADFLQRARVMVRDKAQDFGQITEKWSGRAQRQGVDPRDVLYDPYARFQEQFESVRNIPFRGGSVAEARNTYNSGLDGEKTQAQQDVEDYF